MPYAQSPSTTIDLAVKTSGDPARFAPAVRTLVWDIDRTQPTFSVTTLEQALADSIAPRKFNMVLLGVFGMAALVLAVVGIFGVISYSVTQRTHEIGVRMALGAQPADILNMIFREGLLIVGVGLLVGIAGALAAGQVVGSFLTVSARDPVTYVIVTAILLIVALSACFIPARRAMRVDPMVALRYE
jgi:putative ABC transport system permease protein